MEMFAGKMEFIKKELDEYTTPAYQMVGAGLFQALLGFADTAVVGHYSSVELAGMAAAHGTYILFFAFYVGLGYGLDFIFGKSSSADSTKTNLENIVASSLFALAYGLVSLAGTFVLSNNFGMLGASGQVSQASEAYLNAIALSLPFTMLFFQFQKFNQALGSTRRFFVLSAWINIVNLGLDIAFVFGIDGVLEARGSEGAGYSTLVCRLIMTLFAFYWTVTLLRDRALSRNEHLSLDTIRFSKIASKVSQIIRLGAPGGIQYLADIAVYSAITLAAASLGSTSGSANQISYQLLCITFIVPSCLSSLTSMRVAKYYGEKNWNQSIIAGWVGFFLTSSSSIFFVLPMVLFPTTIASIFTNDALVIETSRSLIPISAFVVLFDALLLASCGALRGLKEVKKPMYATFAGLYAIGLPLSYILFTSHAQNISNIWIGAIIGLGGSTLIVTYYWIDKCAQTLNQQKISDETKNRPTAIQWVKWEDFKTARAQA